MIKSVPSFRTSDGMLHANRYEALKHEYSLELKGLIQAVEKNVEGHYTIGQVANILAKNSSLIIERMKYYNNQINRAKPKESVS